MVMNLHSFGGGELSSIWIANQFAAKGHRVTVHPTRRVRDEFRDMLAKGIRIGNKLDDVKDPKSDLLFFYANDAVYGLKKSSKVWNALLRGTSRSALCLNFVTGPASMDEWRDRWDVIFFLNSAKAHGMLENKPRGKVVILPPPVELEPYLAVKPRYPSKNSRDIRVVRTGRYGRKYDEDQVKGLMRDIWRMDANVRFSFMAAPPFILNMNDPRVKAWKLLERPVADVLEEGNLFWYPLPKALKDQGPRVIVEAMAAGLPVIADNRDGARDRVTPETGWLCDSDQDYRDAFQQIMGDPMVLKRKGEAARKRAVEEFDPQRWIREALG